MIPEIPWHGPLQVISFVITILIAWYLFRLTSFFRGGIFYRPFKYLGPAFLIYSSGSFLDALPELQLGPDWLHATHFFLYLTFFALVTYSFYLFYKEWEKIGMKKI